MSKSKSKAKNIDAARILLQQYSIENLIAVGKQLKRHFTIHVGPTNSGKTYDAIQRLKAAENGQYLGPLRLLALEMFDTLNENKVKCSLLTGEEYIETPGAKVIASTVELADYDTRHDIVVIDECQMVKDKDRGAHWLQAILTIPSSEVILCTAPEALNLLTQLVERMESPYTIVEHKRLAPLSYAGPFKNVKSVQPGDCLIVFSRKSALGLAAELETYGIKASVIYGALPPQSRREEVRRFANGETQVVVATDAIGMGISLPIRRVIFCQTTKFDGTQNRSLNTAEILQIAGRAGRYGIYNEGFVLSMAGGSLIENNLGGVVADITKVVLPFPVETLSSGLPLQDLLREWNNIGNTDICRRMDMSVPRTLYTRLAPFVPANTSPYKIFSLIMCPVNPDDYTVVRYWQECAIALLGDKPIPAPQISLSNLESCEQSYRLLDVQHQMGRRGGVEIDNMDLKQQVSDEINKFLASQKTAFLRKCSRCGKILPANTPYGMCESCYEEMRRHRHCSICGCELPDWWPYGQCDNCHEMQYYGYRHIYDEDLSETEQAVETLSDEYGFWLSGNEWEIPESAEVDDPKCPIKIYQNSSILDRFKRDFNCFVDNCYRAEYIILVQFWAKEIRKMLSDEELEEVTWAEVLISDSPSTTKYIRSNIDIFQEMMYEFSLKVCQMAIKAYHERYGQMWDSYMEEYYEEDGSLNEEEFLSKNHEYSAWYEYVIERDYPLVSANPTAAAILEYAKSYENQPTDLPPFEFADHWEKDQA